MGIFKGSILKQKTEVFLIEHFKNSGSHYYNIVRGNLFSEVKPNRKRKSVAAEHTFVQNLTSEVFMLQKLEKISEELEKRLVASKVSGKTITLKIKYSDFSIQTRSKTVPYFVKEKGILLETAKELLYQEKILNSVRLLGISVTNLNIHSKQKPEKPIMPGETGVIKVKYATDRVGRFSKTVTISSNASEANKVVRIKGEVLDDAASK